MATKENKEKREMDVKFEGLGTFKESTGGGTPIPKGETLAEHPEAHRVQQPRDENGQFTYNAANKKTLKYGPSRGKTIPPYLRIKNSAIEEKDQTRIVKDGKIYDVSVTKSDYSKEQLIKDCREYLGSKYQKQGREQGFDYRTDLGEVGFKTKTGKRSNVEKAAIMSDYKGDIKNLQFNGDSKQLNADWAQYAKNKKPSKAYQSLLGQRTPKQIKPKAQKAVAFVESDVNLAKSNPRAFQAKYKENFNEIAEIGKKANINLSPTKIINLIASGKITGFDELKRVLKKKYKIK